MSIASNPALTSTLSLYRSAQSEHQRLLASLPAGKHVSSASDNAAFWAISQVMGSHGAALSASQDAIGLSQAMADIAAVGLKTAGGIVTEIRSKLLLAASISGGRGAVNAEIDQLKEQLKSLSLESAFAGENWLRTNAGENPGVKSLVASVNDGVDGPAVQTIDHDLAGAVLVAENNAADGLLTRANTVTTPSGTTLDFHLIDVSSNIASAGSTEIAVGDASSLDEISGMVGALDQIMSGITKAAARTGATSSRLSAQDDFLSRLQDSIARGMGGLVDADLEETAIKLNAANLQAKLQVVVINMVNENSKTVLSLFR